jgi:excisionase family DNA binding protein
VTSVGIESTDWSEGAATTPEAQAWLGCSRRTLWRLMDRGELPYRMVGHRRRIPIASLREILPEPAKPPRMRPGARGTGMNRINRMGDG